MPGPIIGIMPARSWSTGCAHLAVSVNNKREQQWKLGGNIVLLLCSARLCLPWKLAQILEGTRGKGSAEQTSMASALADMFPSDLAPLIDMSGKIWAHTVSMPAFCIPSTVNPLL